MQSQEMIPSTDLALYENKVLEKVNPFRTKLNELRELHKEMPDITNTKGKEALKKQIADFRGLKTESEKARKFDKEAINRVAKIVDENYGAVWEDAEKEQKERDAKLKDQIAKEEAEKREKEEAQEKIANERIAVIYELGGRLIGDSYVINGWAIKTNLIKTSPEETWQNSILKGFKEQADIIEQERLAEEKRKQDEAEKLRQEQERLRQTQERLIREENQLKKLKEEFEAKQRESARLLINARLNELDGDLEASNKGWNYKGHIVLSEDDLISFSDEDFNEVRDIHNKRVAEDQEAEAAAIAEEKKRLAIEAEKIALEKSRKSLLATIGITDTPDYDFKEMPIEDWDFLWATLKNNYEKKKHKEWLEMERVKKIQEEEREKERLAEMTDNEKWREWKLSLQKFTSEMPDFKSPRYRRLKAMSLEKFSEIHLFKTDKISSK